MPPRKLIACRTWFIHLALLVTLLVAAPLASAQQHVERSPGPNSPTTKEAVPLYLPEPDQLSGRVSIPDEKLGVLVQPEGREWREFRTVTLRIIAGVLILGIIAGLVVFYFMKGTIRIHAGRSGHTIPRFGVFDRMAHWMTAISFIILALSGLAITFGRSLLIPLVGHEAFTTIAQISKYGHNFFSVPFIVGVLLMLVLWIRDNIPEKADLIWIRQGGGFFSGGGVHPEAGRFNAGQKIIFWSVVLGGIALAVTGYLLMAPFAVTGIGGMQIMHVIHALLAAVMIAVIIGHIYIGTLGMEGAFDAMGRGEVDTNWAREHHSRWYEEMQARGEAPRPAAE